MAKASTSDLFKCTCEQFYKIITDYEKYPEFLSEVKSCRALKTEGNRRLVEYEVQLIKSFRYTLWMTEAPPSRVSWEFGSGDLFKRNTGYWELSEEGGKCRATYSLEVQMTLFVPGPIANTLVNVNLPNMMSSYQKRVTQLYGGNS